jgi:hypothetical protein
MSVIWSWTYFYNLHWNNYLYFKGLLYIWEEMIMMALLHMFSPLWPLALPPIGARLAINVFWTGSGCIHFNDWKVDQATLVVYMWLQSHIEVVELPKWRHRKRPWQEVLACASADFPLVFLFSYYRSSTKCWYTWPKFTWPRMGSLGCTHAQPGFPLFFSGVLTRNDLTTKGFHWVHAQPEVGASRTFFGCFWICCVAFHVRVLTVWYF